MKRAWMVILLVALAGVRLAFGASALPLLVATNAEFPPFEYRENGKLVGVDMELMEAVAAKLGRPLKILDMEFDAVLPAVMGGRVDVAASGLTITPERSEKIDFTRSYVNASLALMVRMGADVKGLEDLKGRSVGVEVGTEGATHCAERAKRYGFTVSKFVKSDDAVQALLSKKVDAVVLECEVAYALRSRHSRQLTVLPKTLTDVRAAFAVRRGNAELVKQINEALKELEDEGVLDAIRAKYYGGIKPTVLRMLNWSDYLSPELVHEFEVQNNCKVWIETFDSNEQMFAKMDSGKVVYDIVVPSHYYVQKMVKKKLLLKLEPHRLPHWRELDPYVMRGLGGHVTDYAVPYFMSYTGIGYRTDLKDFQPSWEAIYTHPDLKGRTTLLDDQMEVIGAAAAALGLKTADLLDQEKGAANRAKIAETVIRWRRNVAEFENDDYEDGLDTGKYMAVMGYSSDLAQTVEDGQGKLAFAMPKEGSYISCDLLAISAKSEQKELAYQFIDFLLTPRNAARNMEEVKAVCPNPAARKLLPDSLKRNSAMDIPEEILLRSEFLPELEPAQERLFDELWNRIRYNAE